MKIILGSESAFRKKALDILGLEYKTIPSYFDEKSIRNDNPLVLSTLLAEAKAKDLGSKLNNSLIITGDLFVVYQNKVYEKPVDLEEAYTMLNTFSGNNLDIVASVAVYNTNSKEILSGVESYTVTFRDLEDNEIENYINRYPVTKFAGAFESDALTRFAKTISGSYPFTTALPMNTLIEFLRKNNIDV